ncbi:hypothetical protein [Guptibacillus algicola]|nr:hypothetical protein [Alkalihalobacillus algicola]MCA0986142.1 hypothetical protein [Alkalihalobacillus algicola]
MVPFHLLIITRVKNLFEPSLSSECHQRDIKQQLSENKMKACRTGSMWM